MMIIEAVVNSFSNEKFEEYSKFAANAYYKALAGPEGDKNDWAGMIHTAVFNKRFLDLIENIETGQ